MMAEAGRLGEAPLPVTDAGERGENAGVVLKEPFVARGGVAGATNGAAILTVLLLGAVGGEDGSVVHWNEKNNKPSARARRWLC